MTDFLQTLLGVSATGGVFILAAILVRAGMKNRMPKHFLLLLWAAVLAHLLLFAATPSPTSIYNYITFHNPLTLEQPPHQEKAPPQQRPGGAPAKLPAQPSEWPAALPFVWLAGMGILAAGFAFCYWTTRKRFDDAILLKGAPAVDRWLRDRKRSVRVYVSDRTATPLSYGLLRPRIILPLDFARDNADRIESVLEHEYVHGSHYHNVMKFLVCIAVIAHWFNPLVWLFWLLFNHDLELACDELALRGIGVHRKAEYAHSLVAVAERMVTPLPLVSAFNARNLRERIVDIMGFKRSSGYWLIPEILLAASLFALFGTAPAASGKADAPMTGEAMHPASVVAVAPVVPEVRLAPMDAEPELPRFIPMHQARRLAVDALGGGEAVEIELKQTRSGGFEYEVNVLYGNEEYEVTLDALDGRVLEIDD